MNPYRAILEDDDQFFAVAVDDEDMIVGFVVASSSHAPLHSDWLTETLVRVARRPFVVVKQVGVTTRARRFGVGRRLYGEALEWADGRPILAAVVDEPPNRASRAFHQRLGLVPLLRALPPDGVPRTVWVWGEFTDADLRLTPLTDTPGSLTNQGGEALRQRYTLAVELYRHEDSLNWQKMGVLLITLAALSGAYANLVQDKLAGNDRWRLVLMLGVLGVGLMAPLALTLRSGLSYMVQRKKLACELEAMIGGGILPTLVGELPGRSLTARVLTAVIYGSLLLWPVAITAYFIVDFA